jgi:importin subunit beta-1
MEHFKPFLSLGLSNCEEHQVCAVAIGVVGDICRALEAAVEPYCDEIVRLLLVNLQNPNLNRNVKPPILSCFGDVALAVGGKFEKYMRVTMSMLVQASGTTVDPENPDLVDYLNQLREGIFEAYTGVLQGLRADGKADVFQPHMMGVLDLIRQVAESVATKTATEEVVCAAVGVVGDCGSALGLTFKNIAKQSPQHEAIKALLKEAVKSGGKSAELAAWTRSECGL